MKNRISLPVTLPNGGTRASAPKSKDYELDGEIYFPEESGLSRKMKMVNRSINQYIIDAVKTEKPETPNQLMKLVQKTYSFEEVEIAPLVKQLEDEKKIHSGQKEASPATLREYVFSSRAIWYWTTIGISIATTIAAYLIPENAYPIVYVRNVLGAISVLWLPGYALMKALFPTSARTGKSSGGFDSIERIALSIGMSIAIVPIIALLLNYTPWGIRLLPLLLSLLATTVAFATVAMIRECQT